MTFIRRHRLLIALLAVLALAVAACGDSDTTDTKAATPIEIPGDSVVVDTFDVEASVSGYLAGIPEGWMALGDITAFKDAMDVGGALLIDVRETGEYAEGHLPGAVNIPIRTLGQNLDKVPTDRQVFIYCQSGYRAALATSAMRILGYDNVTSFPPSYKGWTAAGEEVTTEVFTAETVAMKTIEEPLLEAVDGFLAGIPDGYMSAGDVTKVKDAIAAGAFMLDVRTDGEWADGRIPGATHIRVRTVGDRLADIPTDRQVIVYCKSGHRAALVGAALRVIGYDNVKVFPGSWNAWVDAGEPIEA